jgi:hypothetical protein
LPKFDASPLKESLMSMVFEDIKSDEEIMEIDTLKDKM